MRVLIITQRDVQRGTGRQVAYGIWAEAEDVLVESADCELVHLSIPIEHPRIRLRRSLGRNLRRVRGPSAALPGLPMAGNPLQGLTGHFDVAIFMPFATWDLQLIERLGALRNIADTVVAWFFETWPTSYLDGRVAHEPFHSIDEIFVALEGAVEPLAHAIKRPVHYLPMASDTIRFGPEGPDVDRPIDLIGIGRRRVEQHDAMIRWADDNDRFYLYDSSIIDRPRDYHLHRDNIGRWHASSRLAVCNYGKSDLPALTGGLRIIPGRLWEGLASGAGLIGLPPDEAKQREVLGREVVEPVPTDPGDLPLFLEDKLRRHGPAEMAANVRLALTAHDWAHRWRQLFRHLGLPVPPGIDGRIADLSRRAEKFF